MLEGTLVHGVSDHIMLSVLQQLDHMHNEFTLWVIKMSPFVFSK